MDKSKWPARAVLPVAQPGLKFIVITILITGMLFYFGWIVFAWIFMAITLFICWFFRDPDRIIPEGEKSLICPADGRVIVVEKQAQCDYLSGACIKVSIFMNVFNVHVNRMVYDGTITDVNYHPGKFFSANLDKASRDNEHNVLTLEGPGGHRLVVVQIAGLIARRIVCGVQPGTTLVRGERFGMICFGSRLDVYLPPETKIKVSLGDKVAAGTSTLGYLK